MRKIVEPAVKPRKKSIPSFRLKELCSVLHRIAPIGLAQDWDNVGLLAGDLDSAVTKVILTIDLTEPVANEAIAWGAEAVIAYHPPIFKPISNLRRPSTGTDAVVLRCIREGVAIYSPHTALDAADGGTNDALAQCCDLMSTEPLEFVDSPTPTQCKIVVFVPGTHVETIADAMFDAGAGHIGDYSKCSFRLHGRGTFLGGESTEPTVGMRGRKEVVDEVRLECIANADDVPAIVCALRNAHPYEEPAFDVYSVMSKPVRGIGRVGRLTKPLPLKALAKKLRRATAADGVQIVGSDDRTVERAILVAGSAGSLPFKATLGPADVVITGELRHHDALAILRRDATAIALGHWASEHPVLFRLAERLQQELPSVKVRISEADRDPFSAI